MQKTTPFLRKLFLFMMVSLDGYYEGPNHDISWHHVGEEFNDYAIKQLQDVDMLLFGRVTYQLMASWWPTQSAIDSDPIVAGMMNSLPKLVFSRTLDKVEWNNSRLVKDNVAREIAELKQQPGKDLAIFGSSDLAVSLMQDGLIDELRIIVNPVVLGEGKPLLQGLDSRVPLRLTRTRSFRSGNVLLFYEPDKQESQ